MLQHHAAVTNLRNQIQVMAHHGKSLTGRAQLLNLRNTLLLERLIAHRKNLIHQEDIRVRMHRNREGQTQVHTRRVELHLGIDKVVNLSEIHNRIEGSLNLILGHTQNRAVEVHVIAAGQIRVETSAHLNQTRNIAASENLTLIGAHHARNHLQQRGLTRAVQTQKSHTLTLTNVQAHAVERIELLRKITLAALNQPHKSFLHRTGVAQNEALHQILHVNHHGSVRAHRRELKLLNIHRIRAPGRSCPQTYGRANHQSKRSAEKYQGQSESRS